MKQLILSAGMPRSGSTWLYNAMRIILKSDIGIDLGAGWIQDIEKFKDHETILLKLHGYIPNLASKATFVAYSYRDLRDVMASIKRKFNTSPSMAIARQYLEDDAKWRQCALFAMKYEDMMDEPQNVDENLQKALGIYWFESASICHEIGTLNYSSSEDKNDVYNNENLLHAGHITNGKHGSWKGELDPEFVLELETEFSSWLTENGYTV
jgi:hypothetical protein